MKKTLTILAVLVGIAFLWLTWIYWSTPAGMLPMYFPGYEAGVTAAHFKHGLAALIVALALFVFAWFESGKKKS